MVNKPDTGNFDDALTKLLRDLGNGQLSHEEILYRWDTNRGDDWYTRPVRRGDTAAFPLVEKAWDGTVFQKATGMTLRQYFAGKAMAAIISKHAALKPTTGPGKDAAWDVPRLTAIGAVAYADALIAALDAE